MSDISTEERLKQFREFLKCRIDLYPYFMGKDTDPWKKGDYIDNFTFENWLLKGKAKASYGYFNISNRPLKTPLYTITNEKFNTTHFGTIDSKVPPIVQEGFEYNTFRGIPYNVKRNLYINGKLIKDETIRNKLEGKH